MSKYSFQLTVMHHWWFFGEMTARPELVLLARGTLLDDASLAMAADHARLITSHHRPAPPPEWGALGAASEGPMHWRSLSIDEVRGLAAAVQAVGPFGRRPDLITIEDTSDVFSETEVSGTVGDYPFWFSLYQRASGYRGRDAPALANLMGWLLHLAGIKDDLTTSRLCGYRAE